MYISELQLLKSQINLRAFIDAFQQIFLYILLYIICGIYNTFNVKLYYKPEQPDHILPLMNEFSYLECF